MWVSVAGASRQRSFKTGLKDPPSPMKARRGISSIKILVGLPAILSIAWLGMEFGLVLRAIEQAKTAADSAALAAAARLSSDFEVYGNAAVQAAAANRGPGGTMAIVVVSENAGGDLLLGTWDADSRTFVPDPQARDAVAVTVRIGAGAPNPSPGYVLPNILELVDATFQRTSVATWSPLPAAASVLITESNTGRSLDLSGNAMLESFGDIEVASTSTRAVRIRGAAAITTPTLRVAGGLQGDSEDAVDGFVQTDAVILDDPYSEIAVPPLLPISDGPDFFDPESVSTLEPGRHPDGLILDQGTVRLLPGIHQFGGDGLQITETAEIELVEATIQLLDDAPLILKDKASLTGVPPTRGTWEDVLLIAPKSGVFNILDEATAIVPGVAYCPEGILRTEDDASLVLDGAIVRKLVQKDRTNIRLDRVIIAAPEDDSARARLRR